MAHRRCWNVCWILVWVANDHQLVGQQLPLMWYRWCSSRPIQSFHRGLICLRRVSKALLEAMLHRIQSMAYLCHQRIQHSSCQVGHLVYYERSSQASLPQWFEFSWNQFVQRSLSKYLNGCSFPPTCWMCSKQQQTCQHQNLQWKTLGNFLQEESQGTNCVCM